MNKRRLFFFLPFLLIIVAGFGVYANSLNGEFIWDDHYLLRNNVYITSWDYIPQIFSTDLGNGSGEAYPFYRPLQLITYSFDYLMWGYNVIGYHFVNICLHIMTALSVYWLINILFNDRLLSFLTGMLYVVHPIHTEAVSYISGRADPLAAFFMLLCFIIYIKEHKRPNPYAYFCMVFAYACALMAKEFSIILPALLVLYHYVFKIEPRRREFYTIFVITAIYVMLRATYLNFSSYHDPGFSTVSQRIPGFFVALIEYIRLLFIPFNQHMQYGIALFPIAYPKAIAGMFALTLIILYAILKGKSSKIVFFGILWFFISLLPVLNIYPINAYMSEHWLYLPSIGVFLIIAGALTFLYRNQQAKFAAAGLIIVIIGSYSLLTVKQNKYWQRETGFFETTAKYAPYSNKVWHNLARCYTAAGEYEKSIDSLNKAWCDNAVMYYDFAKAYEGLGKRKEARDAYKKASLNINPVSANDYMMAKDIYTALGDHKKADKAYKKAVELYPRKIERK